MSAVRVLVDDSALPTSVFFGAQWEHQSHEAQSLGGTLSICHTGNMTTGFSLPPTLTSYFPGSDLIIYGTLTKGLTAIYYVDSLPSKPMIFSTNVTGKPNVELWRGTGLLSAYQTLQITPTAGDFVIDYLTYTPDNSTLSLFNLLDGNSLIFDDQHPALEYSQGWITTSKEQYPQGVPYLGTTTGTSTVGSSMELIFNGEQVGVYGALQQVPGILSVSFSVDDAEPMLYTPWDGTQTNSSTWSISVQMFQMSVLAGQHTLRVSLQNATGSQMLWLDSVVTLASFNTTIWNAAGTPIPPPPPPEPKPNPNPRPGISGGAIGGITAGVALLLFISLCLLRLYLRSRRNGNPKPDPPLMVKVPATPTTLARSPTSPIPDTPAPSSPQTAHTHSGPSLQEALRHVFAQQQDAPPAPLQTHWDTDGISNNATQPSHQGSFSHLRSQEHNEDKV